VPSFLLWRIVDKKQQPNFATDHILVYIKWEYWEKFTAKEFAVEDFEWDNVKVLNMERFL
jgi:hypothetical protein